MEDDVAQAFPLRPRLKLRLEFALTHQHYLDVRSPVPLQRDCSVQYGIETIGRPMGPRENREQISLAYTLRSPPMPLATEDLKIATVRDHGDPTPIDPAAGDAFDEAVDEGRGRAIKDLGRSSHLLDAATLASLGLHRPAVHRGQIISGDRFVSSNAECDALRQALPEALAVDMESAAVAQVCRDFGVGFGAVRTISDRADNEAHVDFPRFLDQVARHYSARIIRKALNLL